MNKVAETRIEYLRMLLALEHNSNALPTVIRAAEEDEEAFKKVAERASIADKLKIFLAMRDQHAVQHPDSRWAREARSRAAIVASYEGLEFALAPCEREALLLRAAAPWRIAHEDYRSTYYLMGGDSLETEAAAAIGRAFPLPASVTDAFEEYKYWWRREAQLETLLGNDIIGYDMDVVVQIRWNQVFELLVSDLEAATTEEILIRCQLFRGNPYGDTERARSRIIKDVDAILLDKYEKENWSFTEGAADLTARLKPLPAQ